MNAAAVVLLLMLAVIGFLYALVWAEDEKARQEWERERDGITDGVARRVRDERKKLRMMK